MAAKGVISRELAELFNVLSNPHRVQILAELREGEVDVNGLQSAMGISHSLVSQHLSVLRAHKLVIERRDGRHVYYHLAHPPLSGWILDGMEFVQGRNDQEIRRAEEEVRQQWKAAGGA